jgi:hypothetical protein
MDSKNALSNLFFPTTYPMCHFFLLEYQLVFHKTRSCSDRIKDIEIKSCNDRGVETTSYRSRKRKNLEGKSTAHNGDIGLGMLLVPYYN